MENAKKLLNELSADELNELYRNNTWLREQCADYMSDSVYYQRDEILDYIRRIGGIDYCIDDCGHSYIRLDNVDEYPDFLSACRKLAVAFCVFDEETEVLLNRLYLHSPLYRMYYHREMEISDYRWSHYEKWMESGVKKISSALVEYLLSFDGDPREYLEDFLMNCGNDYATDGTYIYETTYRRFA